MGRYILRRLVVALPTLLVVSVLVAGLLELQAEDVLIGRMTYGYVTAEDIVELRADLGFDKNFPHYYVTWAASALQGDLGRSLWNDHDVLATIVGRARVSGLLALTALGATALTSVGLGLVSVVWEGGWRDRAARTLSSTGHAVPEFFVAVIVMYVLTVWLGWLPSLDPWGRGDPPPTSVLTIIAAALAAGWHTGAACTRATRTAIAEALEEDHVRTARSTGHSDRSLIIRHVLPNVAPSVLRIIGMRLPALLGSVILVEVVFQLQGVGTLIWLAILIMDYPVVQGVLFVAAVSVILATLLIDIARAWLDPRLRYA